MDRTHFVDNHVRVKSGDRVLDIGCGPGEIVRYLPDVEYVGYEPNPDYVKRARINFPAALFHAKIFEESDIPKRNLFDVAIVSAVLHHLDDGEAEALLRMLKRAIKSGGRVVTTDPVYIDDQNPIARFLISLDRGLNVRRPEGYRSLTRGIFDTVVGEVIHRNWPPYTRWIMTSQ